MNMECPPPPRLRTGWEHIARGLAMALPGLPLHRNVPLAALSRWRIGGRAALVVTPRDPAELAACRAWLGGHDVPVVIVGDMTNLLFDDAGLDSVLLRVGPGLRGFRRLGPDLVEAGAGWWVPALVRRLLGLGLAGLEHAIGIPGTLGGLVAMNGGSQRQAVGNRVVAVAGLAVDGTASLVCHGNLGFAYRHSGLLAPDAPLVTAVRLRLDHGDPAVLRRAALATLASRRARFPRGRPNCGSVFASDPATYAAHGTPGALIEAAGLKGMRHGAAQIAPEHANFIVNLGGARASDVLTLIAAARARVHARTGVWMACEVRHVRPDGRVVPAHMSLTELPCG